MGNNVIEQMTLEQKARLLTGDGFWLTKGFDSPAIPSVRMNDGPHGLRKQENADVENINDSNTATCFPTACASACSWDPALTQKIGKSIGEEALHEKVAMVLGCGVNIKRSPLCGRNFEYFSEDPFLAGRMASGWLDGVQSCSVGTSLKHFAVNSQETRRMAVDTIVDERALREIYLSAFEYAVKNSQPTSIMAAYNKVNGEYCTQNRHLLTDILRNNWGFNGIVVSDWGAVNDITECVRNGLDLQMPDGSGYDTQQLVEAVRRGKLTEEELNRAVENMLKFVSERSKHIVDADVDYSANHIVAKDCEAESAVLLKNDGILPLDPSQKVLVVGDLAENMRFQGAGSSHIATAVTPNLIDALHMHNAKFAFVRGYHRKGDQIDTVLEEEAVAYAKKYDVVIFCGGLTDSFEGEGYDRKTLEMPNCQNHLVNRIAQVNKNIVFLAFGGSPMTMPWIDNVRALLHMYLGGQGVGEASYDLLYGEVNPSGKLAESYPKQLSDTPSYKYFANKTLSVENRESIFVGYRYYDTFNIPTLFDFGYGLSYTSFEYSNLKVTKNNTYNYVVTGNVRNVGEKAGKEIVQLYVAAPKDSKIIRARRTLQGFTKIELQPDEEKTVEFRLDKRSFAFFDVASDDWQVESGEYTVEVSASLHDTRLAKTIKVSGIEPQDVRDEFSDYFVQKGNIFTVSDSQFEKLTGRHIIPDKAFKRGEFTLANTLEHMQMTSFAARTVVKVAKKMFFKNYHDESAPEYQMQVHGMLEMPLRTMPTMTGGMLKMKHCKALVAFANGKFFNGLGLLMSKEK